MIKITTNGDIIYYTDKIINRRGDVYFLDRESQATITLLWREINYIEKA